MKNLNNTKQKGYAILFTVVIVGIISMITIGLSNISYKQMMLSSVARDSQISFYQADMASECALYAENKVQAIDPSLLTTFSCGVDSNWNIRPLGYTAGVGDSYSFNLGLPSTSNSQDPCFVIEVDKTSTPGTTKVISKGYNICNTGNLRTVEREIDVSF